MNGQDRDFIAPLMQENTTQSWTEAICIAIADLKDKEGKAMQVFLSDDITEHIRLCKQIAKSLRGGEMSATKPPLYRQTIPPEDHGKVITSRYYSVKPESYHLGMMLNPYYNECNIRIDWGVDGGIYKVEWQNE